MNIPLLPRGYSVPEGRILTPARCFDAQSRTEVLLCSRLMSAADSQNRFMQQLLIFFQKNKGNIKKLLDSHMKLLYVSYS